MESPEARLLWQKVKRGDQDGGEVLVDAELFLVSNLNVELHVLLCCALYLLIYSSLPCTYCASVSGFYGNSVDGKTLVDTKRYFTPFGHNCLFRLVKYISNLQSSIYDYCYEIKST